VERHRGPTDPAGDDERRRYRRIVETANEGFWELDVEARTVFVNPAMAEMLDYEIHTMMGRPLHDFLFPEDHPDIERGRDRRRQGVRERMDMRFRRRDDTAFWARVSTNPIYDEDGQFMGALGVVTDITAQRRAEDELRTTGRLKDRLLYTLSHELRTPLAGVLGFAELLECQATGPSAAQQTKYIGRIKDSVHHLVEIIDQTLTISRSEAGEAEVHWDSVDAVAIATGVVALLAPQARSLGLALELNSEKAESLLSSDGGKLRQILTNLIGNALKFTESGGVQVELLEDSDEVEFRVRDTGPGIPSDQLDRIFEPFSRLHRAEATSQDGTGLGLTISRRLAALLGGEITVDSELGQGSTFSLRLPRHGAGALQDVDAEAED